MSRLSRFWLEVKRRNIVRRNAVYAATAYVLLELTSIIQEPLNLPEWSLTILIILLSIGLIFSIILSWNYDMTSEGLKKLKIDLEENLSEPDKDQNPTKRKFRVSDLIIGLLVIAVIVLAYPKIFKGSNDLNAMTVPVKVKNEFGVDELHDVFKESYHTKLSIFPFTNRTNDSTTNWLQYGIYAAIGEELSQFNYMTIDWNDDEFRLNEQIKQAKSKNFNRFLTGEYNVQNGIFEITSRLYNTENGSVLSERVFKGPDFFSLVDSLSLQTRKDLKISNNILNSSVDLPFNVFMTDKIKAYESYIKGVYPNNNSRRLYEAIELDTTFAIALYYKAYLNHLYQWSSETAIKDIKQAMRHRQRMPDYREVNTRLRYYSILEERKKVVALAEMQTELNPYDTQIILQLISIYNRFLMFQEAEDACKKLNQIIPDQPEYQIDLADAYLKNGKYDKGIEVLDDLLSKYPENSEAILKLGEIYLHKNNLESAAKLSEKAILQSPEDENHWSAIKAHFNYLRNNKIDSHFLEKYAHYYRFEASEIGITLTIHNNHLLAKAKNQNSFFLYPISDTDFIDYTGYFNEKFVLNETKEVVRIDHFQRNYSTSRRTAVWKEDTLIKHAISIFLYGEGAEALNLFQKAFLQNPNHYYLEHYIQHLNFTASAEYEQFLPTSESYQGTYGDNDFNFLLFKKEDQQYMQWGDGSFDKLLPLSKNTFMLPSAYGALLEIVEEGNKITGIHITRTYRDDSFYARVD